MTTLVARLKAARTGGAWFLDEDGQAPFVPWGELLARAERVAGGLRARGLRAGDAVGLVLPDPRPFLEALLGTALAGGVPVPLFPPIGLGSLDAWREGTAAALRATRARTLIVSGEVARVAPALHLDCPELRDVTPVDALDGPPFAAPDDSARPALFQLTSGSTSAPKVVVVTPENLRANVSAFSAGIDVTPADVCVSWLPLYHDMGLVGHALGSIWCDNRVAVMHPLSFLKRPVRWLQAIARFRGTVSFAPNFAYGLVARRATDAELAGLDLSSWRIAGCGAEPVDPATLGRFAARFAAAGFRPGAWLPCYGMAEHTLAVTFPPAGRGLVVERGFVSCGRPFPGHTVEVVGPDGQPRPPGQVGEIVVAGPSVTPGLLGGPPTHGRIATGDLGFVDDGELFVCGRLKDLIVVRGRNHHPHDLERIAHAVDGVRPGGAAAFAVPGRDTEDAVLVVESGADVADAVAARVREATGLAVRVVVVPPRTLPKTTSGKIRRAETRLRFLEGRLAPAAGHGVAWHLAAAGLGRASAFVRGWTP